MTFTKTGGYFVKMVRGVEQLEVLTFELDYIDILNYQGCTVKASKLCIYTPPPKKNSHTIPSQPPPLLLHVLYFF